MRPVWSPIVSTGCVIGVDLGGTKLLAGAVDPALNVHHRATRPARGSDQAAVLETVLGAVLAEWRYGAAAGAREAALLTIGTGIGGGLVVGGALQRGSQGAGAELGHMVVDADGPRCNGNCPSRGCLESVCSGTALAREARRLAEERPRSGLGEALAAGREISGPLVTELAHDGDAAAIEAVAVVGRW